MDATCKRTGYTVWVPSVCEKQWQNVKISWKLMEAHIDKVRYKLVEELGSFPFTTERVSDSRLDLVYTADPSLRVQVEKGSQD